MSFSVGMTTTQLSESINSDLKDYLHKFLNFSPIKKRGLFTLILNGQSCNFVVFHDDYLKGTFGTLNVNCIRNSNLYY